MEAKTQKALEMVEKGRAAEEHGQPAEAIACYKEAIEIDSDCWKAYFRLSSAYRDTRIRDEELNTLRDALEIPQSDQERAIMLNNLSDPLLFYGKVEEALSCLEKAISLEPNSAVCWGNLGSTLVREGEFKRSLAPIERQRELAGDDASGYLLNLGRAEAGLGHYGEAVMAFERLTELHPDRKYSWRELAKVYVELGWYDDAENICKDKLGNGMASYLIRADIRYRTKRKGEAATMTQKALENMREPSYFDEVRWHYCNRVSHQELMMFVRYIAEKLEGTPWPHWILARLATILDDHDVVREQLREVLSIDATLRTNIESDDYFQNIDLDSLLENIE
jgi:tetratricopeptide (TPR) repeat protein